MNLYDALALRNTTHAIDDTRLLEEAQAVINRHVIGLCASPNRTAVLERAMFVMDRIAACGNKNPASTQFDVTFTEEDLVSARLFLAEFAARP